MQKLREECGVFGVYARESREVAATTYYGLFALQHRGQESCGIAVCNDGVIAAHKDLGLVEDVFTPEALTRLGPGHMAVGHVRYGTTGATDRNNAQPIVVNHCKGSLALAHNGNLVNSLDYERSWSSPALFSTPPPIRKSSPMSSPENACPRLPLKRRWTGRWTSCRGRTPW